MEDIALELEIRETTGKAVKHLRSEGTVPAVIHDHGKDSIHVMGPYAPIMKVYRQAGKHHPVQLVVGKKHFTAIIKNVDIDPKKHLLRHVVFNAVNATEKVVAQIPVRARYDEGNESSPAERNGLIVLHNIDSIEVDAIATKLPDFLEYDGEKLTQVGDHATVEDIIVPEGVEIRADLTQTLASVFEPSALQASNDAAGGSAEEEAPSTEASSSETEGETKDESADEKKSE